MSRSGTYSYFEATPAGDADKNWRFGRCNGDYVFAGVYGGRLYSSANRGSSWSEEQPAGAANKYWAFGDVNPSGQMLVGILNGRLYSKLAGSWVEQQPAGATDANWYGVAISPSGTRMMAADYGGRLYSYYDGSWTEERPAGAANKNWYCCDINDSGDMIAGIASGRLYKKAAGGSWSEIQPEGASDKNWRGVAVTPGGTQYVACADNSGQWAWKYDGADWIKLYVQPQYASSTVVFRSADCDASADKIIFGRDGGAGFCNAAMNSGDCVSRHRWSGVGTSASGTAVYGGMSADGTLIVAASYGKRLFIYDKNVTPSQTASGYRKSFTVTRDGGTAYNHKIRVIIYNKYIDDTCLHCEGRANDDFSDVHFKNAVGDALRHCIVNDDEICASLPYGYYRRVWIELDEVGSSPTTFYMYYGDSEQSDTSTAPADFFDVYDDFERGAHLDAVGGVWTVTAGTVRISTAYPWKGGTRCVEFVGGSTKGAANIAVTASNETYIGFWAIKAASGGLTAQHGDGSTYAQWAWNTDGTIKNYTGGSYGSSLLTNNADRWHPFEMYGFDWSANTYDLYTTNGAGVAAIVGDNLAMQASAGYTNILQLANLGGSSTNYLYIDQLVICSNCNPYATPDSESIGAEVLVGEVVYSGPAGVKTWNDIPSASIKTWNDIPWNTIKTMN